VLGGVVEALDVLLRAEETDLAIDAPEGLEAVEDGLVDGILALPKRSHKAPYFVSHLIS